MFGDKHPQTGEIMRAPFFGDVLEVAHASKPQVVISVHEECVQTSPLTKKGDLVERIGFPGTVRDNQIIRTVGHMSLQEVIDGMCKTFPESMCDFIRQHLVEECERSSIQEDQAA